jgi:hypothetical protein
MTSKIGSTTIRYQIGYIIVAGCFLITGIAHATTNGIFENRNDRFRSGANLQETILNVSNVNNITFGNLFNVPVDGLIYAQPLYVANVMIPSLGSTRNLLLVATMEDTVIAFDADTGAQIWKKDYRSATVSAVPIADILGGFPNYGDIDASSDVGIQGTPVIDSLTNTMYFVARTKETANNVTNYVQRLHALNIATGLEITGSGAAIAASVGNGAGGSVTFNPLIQMQRPGLTITNGQVVVCWGSHEDNAAYHGWVIAFDKITLRQTGAFVTTKTALGAAIWQAGRAPAVLANGDIVVFTSNSVSGGSGTGYDGQNNFSESILELRPTAGGISLIKAFTARNWAYLDQEDLDFGSSGPVVIPKAVGETAEYIIGGGKDGTVYTVNAQTAASGFLGDPNSYLNVGGDQRGGLIFWDKRAAGGPLQIYSAAPSQTIGLWRWGGADFNRTQSLSSGIVPGSYPGGILSLSANGARAGTGILWSLSSDAGNAEHDKRSGVLRAFNADTLQPIWDSITYSKDDVGLLSKFAPPTIANGKVYVASFSRRVAAFGLLPTPNPQPTSYVKLISRLDPTLVLEVAGASQSNQSRIQLGRDADWGRQRWKMVAGAKGRQFISALNSNMVLDVVYAGQAAGTPVNLYSSNGTNAQYWKLTQNGNGYTQIISVANNLALNVQGAYTTDGTLLQTWTINGTAAQDWIIEAEPDGGLQECFTPDVVIESRATGKLLTFTSGATNFTTAVIATSSANANQTFIMSTNLDGSYSFQSNTDGLFLDVVGAGTTEQTPVDSYQGSGTNAQQWDVNWPTDPNGNNGYMQLVPLSSPGLTLDVQWAGQADGTPLQIWDFNGTFAQDWAIYDAANGMQCRFRTPF